jgi:hypothetical protein
MGSDLCCELSGNQVRKEEVTFSQPRDTNDQVRMEEVTVSENSKRVQVRKEEDTASA